MVAARTAAACAANQVLYNLGRRGIEFDLLPVVLRERNIPVMAYSPVEQGRLSAPSAPSRASRKNAACRPAQIALAWVLHEPRA